MVKFGNFTPEFKQGVQAYADGVTDPKNNPYKHSDTKRWEDWKDGWGFARCWDFADYVFGEADKKEGDIYQDHKADI